MPDIDLTPFEVRVLGSLAEKAFLTPDVYPLSLNAVSTACNQLSNREPVMQLSDETVQQCLDSLREKHLVRMWWPAGSRIPKFDHVLPDVYGVDQAQLAVLTMLMLRGFQTSGEIRGRTARMHSFREVEQVEAVLKALMERTPPLIAQLPRAPGTKEARYTHLFCGERAVERQEIAHSLLSSPVSEPVIEASSDDRFTALEAEIKQLRSEVNWLAQEFAQFRKQFE